MRVRVVILGAVLMLAACASGGDSDTGPTIGASLPSDASIVTPTPPQATNADTAPAETQPDQQPELTAAPESAPSSSGGTDDGGDIVWWPWALGAIVVVIAIVAIARWRRPGLTWQTRATTLLDEIDLLTSHLATVDDSGLRAVAQSDAIRLATMRATLADLIASAPDPHRQMPLQELTAPITALHGAVDAIAISADPSAQPAATSVHQLAAQLHTASASERASLVMRH